MAEEKKNYQEPSPDETPKQAQNEPQNEDPNGDLNEVPNGDPAAELFTEDAFEPSRESAGEPNRPNGPNGPKRKKRIGIGSAIIACIAVALAAVMVTYTCCNSVYKRKLADLQTSGGALVSGADDRYYPFELFDSFFEAYSFEELNEEEMMNAALKAYVYATGDPYAEYYTAEEYAALLTSSSGSTQGIGVNIINTAVTWQGQEYKVLRVIHVTEGSPAGEAGLLVGDCIYAAGIGAEKVTVNELDYDEALTRLQGAAGTEAKLTILRPTEGGDYTELEFTITRSAFVADSVYYHVCETDPTVGIVKILQFDLTTPAQFSKAVDTLKNTHGCQKFVFDVRYNPGGDLLSIEAVLSYFLSEGDVLIRTRTKGGEEEVSYVKEVTYDGSYAGCSVTKADIGKYSDLQAVILCNGGTASAAELFTATFRDYDKLNATIVGTTTFGKGSMQTIRPLVYLGYRGALKLTTALYFPASGEGYDGVGITPDVTEELSEAAASVNIYELSDAEDNQLQKGLESLR